MRRASKAPGLNVSKNPLFSGFSDVLTLEAGYGLVCFGVLAPGSWN